MTTQKDIYVLNRIDLKADETVTTTGPYESFEDAVYDAHLIHKEMCEKNWSNEIDEDQMELEVTDLYDWFTDIAELDENCDVYNVNEEDRVRDVSDGRVVYQVNKLIRLQ